MKTFLKPPAQVARFQDHLQTSPAMLLDHLLDTMNQLARPARLGTLQVVLVADHQVDLICPSIQCSFGVLKKKHPEVPWIPCVVCPMSWWI